MRKFVKNNRSNRGGDFKGGSSSYRGRGHSSGRKKGYIDESKFINRASERVAVKYTPEFCFSDLKIDGILKNNIKNKGYENPTLIQNKAIPVALDGRDIIGIANTGTGKTAAFLIPLINKVLKKKGEKVLIIAPTRELAEQISAEFRDFSKEMKMFSVLAVGGMNIRSQIMNLRKGVSFTIGTPGRINDLVERKVLKLEEYNNIVLDEADRMLDMGFVEDVRNIFKKLPEKKQVLFFSATFEREIERLANDFLTDPVRIEAKTGDTSENVDQDVVRYERYEEKMDLLHDLLIGQDFKKVLIFGETKMGVEDISLDLNDRGLRAVSIHGDKSQHERRTALKMFKEERVKILVATDVAARGIDIPDVSHVINYDIPHTYEDYIHRIGRTGRASSKGKALTFVKNSLVADDSRGGRRERAYERRVEGSERGRRNGYGRKESSEGRGGRNNRGQNRKFRR